MLQVSINTTGFSDNNVTLSFSPQGSATTQGCYCPGVAAGSCTLVPTSGVIITCLINAANAIPTLNVTATGTVNNTQVATLSLSAANLPPVRNDFYPTVTVSAPVQVGYVAVDDTTTPVSYTVSS